MRRDQRDWARSALPRQHDLIRHYSVGDKVRPVVPLGDLGVGTIVGFVSHPITVTRDGGIRPSDREVLVVDSYEVRWGGPSGPQSNIWNDLMLRPA